MNKTCLAVNFILKKGAGKTRGNMMKQRCN